LGKVKEVLVRGKDEEDEYEDELEREMKRLEREEIRRSRLARLREYRLESELRARELEAKMSRLSSSELGEGKDLASGLIASLVKAGVKPEQANEFLSKLSPEALATLSALSSNNPYLPLFLFVSSQSRNVPPQSLTISDIVQLNRNTLELARGIAEGMGGRGGGEESLIMTAFNTLANVFRDMYQMQAARINELKELLKEHKSDWDRILEDEQKFKRLKELLTGGPQGNPDLELKLEQMRQEFRLRLEELKMRRLELQARLAESKRRRKMLAEALKKIGEAVASGIREAGQEHGYQGRATFKCPKCNGDIEVDRPAPGMKVECPSCKSQFMLQEGK